jgi:hypothetical protein
MAQPLLQPWPIRGREPLKIHHEAIVLEGITGPGLKVTPLHKHAKRITPPGDFET